MTAQPNAELMQLLREEMGRYTHYDNQLRELNKEVYALREHRSTAEDNKVDIISKNPIFSAVQELQAAGGQAKFRIRRPNEGFKPWTLSKGMLRDYLIQHLGAQQGAACYEFVHNAHQATLRNTEYAIQRTDRE